jgi:hypothetical protein
LIDEKFMILSKNKKALEVDEWDEGPYFWGLIKFQFSEIFHTTVKIKFLKEIGIIGNFFSSEFQRLFNQLIDSFYRKQHSK